MYITVVVEVHPLPFPLATADQRILDRSHLARFHLLATDYTRNDKFLETVSLSGWKAEGRQTIKIELWGEARCQVLREDHVYLVTDLRVVMKDSMEKKISGDRHCFHELRIHRETICT
jgi:hypothetical protein